MQDVNKQRKSRSQRRGARVTWIRPVILIDELREIFMGHTTQLSLGGISVRVNREISPRKVKIYICIKGHWHLLEGRIAFCDSQKRHIYPSCFDIGIAFSDKNIGSKLWSISRSVFENEMFDDPTGRFLQSI